MDEINIATYNCQGFGLSKYAYIKGLLRKSNFVFLQEHWLHTADMQSMCNSGVMTFHGCSSMPDNVLLQGHPYGGVAILWLSEFNHFVRLCKQFSTHYCAVQVNFNSLKCVFFCVYTPTDNQINFVNEELHNTLNEIETLISSLNVDVIFLGDNFKANFNRNNVQSNYDKAFCDRVNLLPCVSFLNHFFTYTRSQGNSYSIIDNFMISNIFDIKKSCVGLELLDDSVVNEVKCSDHDAVLLRLNLPIVRHAHSINEPTTTAKQVAWHKANTAHIAAFKKKFAEKVTSLLSSFPIDFLYCHGCSSPLHISLVDKYAVKLQIALIDCSNFCIFKSYFLNVEKTLL